MTEDRPIRILRWVAWLCLGAGMAAAVALWLHVPQTVTTVETIGGHGTATFEGVRRELSGFFALMGGVAMLGGVVLWAILRVVAGIAADLRTMRENGRAVALRSGDRATA